MSISYDRPKNAMRNFNPNIKDVYSELDEKLEKKSNSKDFQALINEILIKTKRRSISKKNLKLALRKIYNEDTVSSLCSQFVFFDDNFKQKKEIVDIYKKFNSQIIILDTLNSFSESICTYIIKDLCKQSKIKLHEKLKNSMKIRYNTLKIILFLMFYIDIEDFEYKTQILFKILDNDSNQLISHKDPLIFRFFYDFIEIGLNFNDNYLNYCLIYEKISNDVLLKGYKKVLFFKKLFLLIQNPELKKKFAIFTMNKFFFCSKKSDPKLNSSELYKNFLVNFFDVYDTQIIRKSLLIFQKSKEKSFEKVFAFMREYLIKVKNKKLTRAETFIVESEEKIKSENYELNLLDIFLFIESWFSEDLFEFIVNYSKLYPDNIEAMSFYLEHQSLELSKINKYSKNRFNRILNKPLNDKKENIENQRKTAFEIKEKVRETKMNFQEIHHSNRDLNLKKPLEKIEENPLKKKQTPLNFELTIKDRNIKKGKSGTVKEHFYHNYNCDESDNEDNNLASKNELENILRSDKNELIEDDKKLLPISSRCSSDIESTPEKKVKKLNLHSSTESEDSEPENSKINQIEERKTMKSKSDDSIEFNNESKDSSNQKEEKNIVETNKLETSVIKICEIEENNNSLEIEKKDSFKDQSFDNNKYENDKSSHEISIMLEKINRNKMEIIGGIKEIKGSEKNSLNSKKSIISQNLPENSKIEQHNKVEEKTEIENKNIIKVETHDPVKPSKNNHEKGEIIEQQIEHQEDKPFKKEGLKKIVIPNFSNVKDSDHQEKSNNEKNNTNQATFQSPQNKKMDSVRKKVKFQDEENALIKNLGKISPRRFDTPVKFVMDRTEKLNTDTGFKITLIEASLSLESENNNENLKGRTTPLHHISEQKNALINEENSKPKNLKKDFANVEIDFNLEMANPDNLNRTLNNFEVSLENVYNNKSFMSAYSLVENNLGFKKRPTNESNHVVVHNFVGRKFLSEKEILKDIFFDEPKYNFPGYPKFLKISQNKFLQEYFSSFDNESWKEVVPKVYNFLENILMDDKIQILVENSQRKLFPRHREMVSKYIESFDVGSIYEIWDLNINPTLINLYFSILQLYNDFLFEPILTSSKDISQCDFKRNIKVFDLNFFEMILQCYNRNDFNFLNKIFKNNEYWFKIYSKFLIPIYSENSNDGKDNLFLALLNFEDIKVTYFDAKGILIEDKSIATNYTKVFEEMFKFLIKNKISPGKFRNWDFLIDENVPDYFNEYSVIILLIISGLIISDKPLEFKEEEINKDSWRSKIFSQISLFFIKLYQ